MELKAISKDYGYKQSTNEILKVGMGGGELMIGGVWAWYGGG